MGECWRQCMSPTGVEVVPEAVTGQFHTVLKWAGINCWMTNGPACEQVL